MQRKMNSRAVKAILASLVIVPALAFGSGGTYAQGLKPASTPQNVPQGAVYTLTNAAAGNAVAVFDRDNGGHLTPAGSYPTHGLGTGAGLGSQGAVILSKGNKWLLAVNAGSNEISSFSVDPVGLTFVDKVASGGMHPISLTAHKDLLYVLNDGGAGNITGFKINGDGTLTAIPRSTRSLSSAASGPAEVQFSPDGRVLVVTEKATNMIDTYTVDHNGVADGPATYPSNGMTPFGFAFDSAGHLLVSEAFGGAPNASATSSYDVERDGSVNLISGSVGTQQTAACWLVITKNGRYAYTTNAGSGSISSYTISADGSLTLLESRAGDTGAGSSPIDAAFNNNSHYLYALGAGSHSISGFAVATDGSLTPVGGATVLPAGDVGLAAR